jgi:hypothetical protein
MRRRLTILWQNMTINRHDAIRVDNAALDELARLQREIETLNLLIVHFADKPNVVRRLADIRARLLAIKHEQMWEWNWASKQI